MSTSGRRATIRVYGVNKRAGEEAQRLLRWLEDFVKVGDTLDDYRRFGITRPNFWPIGLHAGSGEDLAWTPKAYKLFLAYRECLRRVWRRDKQALDNVELAFLLGMSHSYFDREGFGVPEFVCAAWADLSNARCSANTWAAPIWNCAEFVFYPHNDFQRAVYLLFRESWRARTCERCSECFLADKPAQRFCSSECFGEAKRNRDLAYWRSHGAERRKSRKNASRRRQPRGARALRNANSSEKPRRLPREAK